MMVKENNRVVLIRDYNHNEHTVNIFGTGIYMGKMLPSKDIVIPDFAKTPFPESTEYCCFKRDDGVVFWQWECWWMHEGDFNRLIIGHEKWNKVIVEKEEK